MDTSHTLDLLAQRASVPLDQAMSSPPSLYTDPAVLDMEIRQIFEQDWHCPGLAADVPEAGDYITFSIGEQQVFSMRQKDGSIRTFSNVCRHRMMQCR